MIFKKSCIFTTKKYKFTSYTLYIKAYQKLILN